MSFEIQELTHIITIIILLHLKAAESKDSIKRMIDKICASSICIEMEDLERTLKEMASEGLIVDQGGMISLTERGAKLGREWRSLLLKREPILEVVAGLTDGSITGLVVILSSFIAGLTASFTEFAALLTLASVAMTNFSSFFLGGMTEDMADIVNLQTLMNYSLGDIPDKEDKDKSLLLVNRLFTVLHDEISKSNLYAAVICGSTTFIAGIVPIIAYLSLPGPLNIILSLVIVASVVGIFLVRYRSKKTKVHWKVTLFETITIIAIAVLASLLIGGRA